MRKAAVFVAPRRSPLRLLVWAALWMFAGVGLLLFALGLRAPAAYQWAPARTADDERPAFVRPPEVRFNRERRRWADRFNVSLFDCSSSPDGYSVK
ncbi:hypothetical protein M3Y99_01554300 [Aphelenchoides fujianensis]|nr:hypothetical protein M3Y99_01554300 [Aphelenchoides fujianensis]